MTKLIAVVVIVLVLFGGYELFLYWEKVSNEKDAEQKQAASSIVDPNSLPGMPYSLNSSLQAAEKQGPAALKAWLKTYDRQVQDPRRAWVELDYVVMIAREDPAEARKIFASVKDRTPATSPVYTRVKQLEKTYE